MSACAESRMTGRVRNRSLIRKALASASMPSCLYSSRTASTGLPSNIFTAVYPLTAVSTEKSWDARIALRSSNTYGRSSMHSTMRESMATSFMNYTKNWLALRMDSWPKGAVRNASFRHYEF
jgi:hypothetical protein